MQQGSCNKATSFQRRGNTLFDEFELYVFNSFVSIVKQKHLLQSNKRRILHGFYNVEVEKFRLKQKSM